MNIKTVVKILTDGGIVQNEAKIEAKMLVESVLGLSDKDLIMDSNFEAHGVSEDKIKKLIEKAKLRSEKRIPIQHIIGTAYFMSENFIVNNKVLIPRDETEFLVRKCIDIINGHGFSKVLDIGTGSGCIACIIAKETKAQVLGVDVSLDALSVALDNSSKMNLFNKAVFRKSDLFSKIRSEEKFDLIVSNPPYIPLTEKETLQKEVEFDPEEALFAPDKNGIRFYKRIAQKAPLYLNKSGYLAFELGINQSELVKKLMLKDGFSNIEIIKDLAGIDRVIIGQKV